MIEHGVVYAITQDPSYVTRVVAVRESDGKLLWRGPLVGSMTVDESAIAVTETFLYVLDPATGVERWHEDIRGCFGAQPWPEPTPRGDRR